MRLFLAINSGYTHFDIGLYKDNSLIESITEANKKISKELIYLLSSLLNKHKIDISDLDFIATNQGPGPFTSLRAILTTINGISFIKNIPLVGINGIEAFLEQESIDKKNVIVLLNAFCKDVYYALKNEGTILFGSKNIEEFLKNFLPNIDIKDPVYFIGNGAELYKELISIYYPNANIINSELKLDSVANKAIKIWPESIVLKEIMPIYLKNYS